MIEAVDQSVIDAAYAKTRPTICHKCGAGIRPPMRYITELFWAGYPCYCIECADRQNGECSPFGDKT